MTSLRTASLGLVAGTILTLGSANAQADCVDPFHCVCVNLGIPSNIHAGVVDSVDADIATVTIDAVAASETSVMVGDTIAVDGFDTLAVGSRWLVIWDGTEGQLRQEIPADEQFRCLDTAFTVQQVLDFTASDTCRDDARAQSSLSDDEIYGCDDTVSWLCTASAAVDDSPSNLPAALIGLTLLGGALARRRRSTPTLERP